MLATVASTAKPTDPPTAAQRHSDGVRKLEAAGFVARQPCDSDRRVSIVEVTPEGRKIVEQLKDIWIDLAEETMTGITDTRTSS